MAKETATKTRDAETGNQQQSAQQGQRRQEVAIAGPRLPYPNGMEERFGVDKTAWRALTDAIYPSAETPEAVILALAYCKSRGLDPFKRPVHIVPVWNSKLGRNVETVWPGINELRTTAFRTREYAGCDPTVFGPMRKKLFEGKVGKGQYEREVSADVEFPEWAQITVYRIVGGVKCAFPGPRLYWLAAYGAQGKSDVPNDKWQEGGGSYMLEKCAEAAALRKAFPEETAGMLSAEEMEGRKVDDHQGPTIDHEPVPPRPTRESVRREAETARQDDYERNRQFRETMAEDAPREPDRNDGGDQGQGPNNAAVDHDEETGEVRDPEPKKETAKTDAPKQTARAWAEEANAIMDKLEKAGSPKTLNGILTSQGEFLDLMKEESPDDYALVIETLKKRREWFAR